MGELKIPTIYKVITNFANAQEREGKTLSSVVMRHIFRYNHWCFNKPGNHAVSTPRRLENQFLDTTFADCVSIGCAEREHLLNFLAWISVVAFKKVFPDNVTMLCKCLAWTTVHINNPAVDVADCNCIVHVVCPSYKWVRNIAVHVSVYKELTDALGEGIGQYCF